MFNRRDRKNPQILIMNMCEKVFKKRYRIYDEDVISDAMASIIFQYRKNNSEIKSLEGWIVGAIHYHYIAFIRNKEKSSHFTFDTLLIENAESDDYPHTKLEFDEIYDIINKLDHPQKEIIKMRILDGLAYKDIAEKLNIKVATARKNFERGITNIKKTLQLITLVFGLSYGT